MYPLNTIGLRALLVSLSLFFCVFSNVYGQTFTDEGFSVTTIRSSLPNDLIGFTVLPDSRILTIRRAGHVQVLVEGSLSTPLLSLSDVKTAGNGEQGLLGITTHFGFPDSNFVYLFYTQDDDTNAVVRYRITGDLDDPESANLVFDLNSRESIIKLYNETQYHQAGSIRFGTDDKLYISHGDDSRKHFIQDYRNYRGKILRLNPNGTAPPDNPVFADMPSDGLGGIFAVGFRNPFRFAVDPQDGSLFIGDVGSETREEVNIAYGGENFGWPRYEGNFLSIDTSRLVGPAPTAPLIDYAHSTGNFSAIALCAYRPVAFPNDASFPAEYDGALFYADYFRGPLYALTPNGDGTYTRKNFAQSFVRLVDAALLPDGSMLVLESGKAIKQISFDSGVANSIDPNEPENTPLSIYPNPFDELLEIKIDVSSISQSEKISIQIYNTAGSLVRNLEEFESSNGSYNLTWDCRNHEGRLVPKGLYYCQLQIGQSVFSQKILRQ